MKKKAGILVLLVFAAIVISACGQEPVEIQSEYVSMMEKPVSEKQIEKVEEYLDKNLSAMKSDAADEMLIEYETYIYPFYNGKVDYDKIEERYGKYASNAYEKLCILKKLEQEKPAVVSSKLSINRKQLCKRANDVELFIKQNKDSEALRQDADSLYKNYVKLLLEGSAEEPNFDLKSGAFSKEAKRVYTEFQKNNPDTVLAKIFDEYLGEVKAMNYKLDYSDATASKEYYNTCAYLESEAGKRVMQ